MKIKITSSLIMPLNSGTKHKFYLILIMACLVLLIFSSSCRHYILKCRLSPPSFLQPSGNFLAGAAKTDITPPPGYPKGGFSIAGAISRGVWLHLYSRAIYLEDQKGLSLVLISCDLMGIPGGLVDLLAEILHKDEKLSHIGRQNIILAATHTHHSPGNYFTSELYNKYASQREGFDPDLFNFLVHQIYRSIKMAYENREPADIFYTAKPSFRVSRNRSIPAFNMNKDREEILEENRKLLGISTEVPEEDIAVNPLLHVLKILSRSNPPQPIAITAFYAVHPTVIQAETEVYNSDLFGVVTTLVEQEFMRERGTDKSVPVIALFNGAEGDVSPRWERQNRRTALDLGSKLAQRIMELYQSDGRKVDGEISTRCKWTHLSNYSFIDDEGNAFRTATKAKVGAPALGGAEDGRTFLYDLGWKEGLKAEEPSPEHGVKLDPLIPSPSSLTKPITDFLHIFVTEPEAPSEFLLGIYQVGSVAIVPFPGEFSVTLGRRVLKSVKKHIAEDNIVLLVGCSGEHISYFVTPEEYDAQHFEGASMLYGPYAGLLIQTEAGRLLNEPLEDIYEYPQRKYDTGVKQRFGAKTLWPALDFPYQGLKSLLENNSIEIPNRNFPKMTWEDRAIKWPPLSIQRASLYPEVKIEEKVNDAWVTLKVKGIPETDEGLNFITVLFKAGSNMSIWGTIWMPPESLKYYPRLLRFSVLCLDGKIRHSEPFSIEKLIDSSVGK